MSDERWIKVGDVTARALHVQNTDAGDNVCGKYLAAEGQRVRSIRWCETHGDRAEEDDACLLWTSGHHCVIVGATLILPPKEQA